MYFQNLITIRIHNSTLIRGHNWDYLLLGRLHKGTDQLKRSSQAYKCDVLGHTEGWQLKGSISAIE